MKKRRVLKNKVEKVLIGITCIAISYIGMTVDNVGNNVYNLTLVATIGIIISNLIVLNRYGKGIDE